MAHEGNVTVAVELANGTVLHLAHDAYVVVVLNGLERVMRADEARQLGLRPSRVATPQEVPRSDVGSGPAESSPHNDMTNPPAPASGGAPPPLVPSSAPNQEAPGQAGANTSGPSGNPTPPTPAPAPTTPTPPAPAPATGPAASPAGESEADALRRIYPVWAVYVDHPELGPILRQAAEEGWDVTRLENAVKNTDWWKTHSNGWRALEDLRLTNPGEYTERLNKTIRRIHQLAISEYGAVELGPDDIEQIAVDALTMNWTTDEILAGIRGHRDFVQRSEDEANFIALERNNQPELLRQIDQATREIERLAESLGVSLPADELRRIARDAVRNGWSQAEVENGLIGRVKFDDPTRLFGRAGEAWAAINAVAGDYLLEIGNDVKKKWATDILKGVADQNAFTEYAKQYAASMFPSLKPVFDSGVTLRQYVEPYRAVLGRTLEMNPEDINWFDQKWKKVLQGTRTKEGLPAPMTLWQAELYAKSLDEWQYTNNARDQYVDKTEKILKMFGGIS